MLVIFSKTQFDFWGKMIQHRPSQIACTIMTVHANGIAHAQKYVDGIDWEHNWELLIAFPHRPLCFKKITSTTTTFLIPTQQTGILATIVQHSILTLSHPYLNFKRSLSVWYSNILWLSNRWYFAVCKQQLNWNFLE